MIAHSYIHANLHALDKRYNKTSGKDALFCSKLALIEVCGWIEESMDDIVLRCSVRHLKESANRKYVENEIVKRNFGFDYANFRSMLIRLLGLINMERIEAEVDQTKYQILKAGLSSLKQQRDREAHTHLKGMTRTVAAPSYTMSQFAGVYDGLIEFDRVIRSRRW